MPQPSDSSIFYDAISATYDVVSEERRAYINGVNNLIVGELLRHDIRGFTDIGCGNGTRTITIAKAANSAPQGLDSSPRMVEQAVRRGVAAQVGDISQLTTIPSDLLSAQSAVLCLWNVLGHIATPQSRQLAVNNMSSLLRPGGLLMIDVNNRYNSATYTKNAATKNVLADVMHPTKTHGDFVTTKQTPEGGVTTSTHIFSPQELVAGIVRSGLSLKKLLFVDYDNGSVKHSPFKGQIFAVAQKKGRKL